MRTMIALSLALSLSTIAACSDDAAPDLGPDAVAVVDASADGAASCGADRACACNAPGTACWSCAPGTHAHSACVAACVANVTTSDTWCPAP